MSSSDISPGPVAPGGELALPTPPGAARRFWSRHPWLTDAAVASGYLLPVLLGWVVTAIVVPGAGPQSLADSVSRAVMVVVVTIALLVRRHAPRTVLVVSWAGLIVSYPGSGPADALPVLIGLYALAVYRSAVSAWIGLAASVTVGFLAAFVRVAGSPLVASAADAAWIVMGSQYAVSMLAATLVGVNLGDRRRYEAALLALAGQLAEERDRQAGLARVAEQARIAREMHDIVAHSLSVMVALADGSAALVETDPERSRTAMRQVAGTGRASLVEMRRLLGILADGADFALSPQPGIDQLAELVQTFRAAGLPTRLEVEGRGPENAGIQLTVYRIVQESLTNSLRYAHHPTRVTVRLRLATQSVEVLVDDDGDRDDDGGPAVPGAPATAVSQGSGRGLIGLRERVALYGGALQAGPGPHAGWRVHATMTLPTESPR
ncbi:MAG: histidine kinase [Cryobacterium sp.]